MLTGKQLGAALREAISLKQVSIAEVAREFGVKGPSVYDWLKYGRIGKPHLEHLVTYFADVVPPSHWGLAEATLTFHAPRGMHLLPDEQALIDKYRAADAAGKRTLQTVGDAVAQPDVRVKRRQR